VTPSRRFDPTTCSSVQRRRRPAGLGRSEQGRHPSGRRAAPPATSCSI
jgi:hypothetical protein